MFKIFIIYHFIEMFASMTSFSRKSCGITLAGMSTLYPRFIIYYSVGINYSDMRTAFNLIENTSFNTI